MIPQTFIQDLLHRVDIVDVIDRHVKLKRAGANYVACCPFHSEKSPSFTVSQTKQFYHCFGCSAHGTAVGFLMEYSGMGFVDAVKELAQGVGMTVPEERSETFQRKRESENGENLHEFLLKAAQFYRGALRDAPRAIEYLKKRGLSGEVAKNFGIGYAPDGWQNLQGVFADYDAKALNTVGLVKQNEQGRRYDIFRDRIMFPIVDVRGNIIGFGGRVLDSGEPKYLNSPETPLFEKGRELYGLFQARRAIRDAGRVIVVEGYMDVVALAQFGVEYSVATLGTATTPLHVQKLLRQTDEIVYCFDGDAAGRRAAWRALENSLAQLADGKQIKFLFLPQGDDPDSYVRQHGKAQFEKMLNDAVPLSQFLLSELSGQVDIHTHEGRAKLLQEAKPLVKQISAPVLSLMLRKELARIGGIEQHELDAEFQIKSVPRPAAGPARVQAVRKSSLVRQLIALLAFDPSLAVHAERQSLAGKAERVDRDIDVRELHMLGDLLEMLADNSKVASVAELFRGSPHETLAQEIEGGLLQREELSKFTPDEMRQEFADGWRSLLTQIGRSIERKNNAMHAG